MVEVLNIQHYRYDTCATHGIVTVKNICINTYYGQLARITELESQGHIYVTQSVLSCQLGRQVDLHLSVREMDNVRVTEQRGKIDTTQPWHGKFATSFVNSVREGKNGKMCREFSVVTSVSVAFDVKNDRTLYIIGVSSSGQPHQWNQTSGQLRWAWGGICQYGTSQRHHRCPFASDHNKTDNGADDVTTSNITTRD
ncbi:hypothetical protein CBL_07944 [Carabus blaptoides fortunei]